MSNNHLPIPSHQDFKVTRGSI